MDDILSVQRFAELAEEYCAFIDGALAMSTEDLVFGLARILPLLYHAALDLPCIDEETDSEETDEDEDEGASLPDARWRQDIQALRAEHDRWFQTWQRIQAQVKGMLGAVDQYWEVFDPYLRNGDKEPLLGEVSDDIADIYLGVSRGLDLYRRGLPDYRRDALYEWSENFRIHWGDHLVDALRALHRQVTHRLNWGKLDLAADHLTPE